MARRISDEASGYSNPVQGRCIDGRCDLAILCGLYGCGSGVDRLGFFE